MDEYRGQEVLIAGLPGWGFIASYHVVRAKSNWIMAAIPNYVI